ncbi:hypothetical protein O0I10_002762 [Lichtheimia ornata]|uniref:Serologically defined colon cancer antigen 1 n=1 Tax=Lichtheimia ornata TaxID=688661 RepID=A0AAD7VC52_9FUNG|nr:uncharacterized protein O0I10_002762 [Lichtheimia ornata]KAJ8661496.1 hypothetical protein O0I10_002762 [Lichtheimia ornata]
MKQRFSALDIRATVINFRERLTNLRLQNIYDVDAKTFLLKFAKPDDKELVLIESGIRLHSTQFSRDKQVTPSPFCAKIRKHLRTRRLTNVRQLGVDRVVDFEFAGSEKSIGYHIIAEFYSSGNIIFTDEEYKILALLRVVNSGDVKMAVGDTYDVQRALPDFPKIEFSKLQSVLRNAGPKDTLKKVLNISYEYGPAMVEHIILRANLDPGMKVASEFDCSDDSPALKALMDALKEGDEMIESTKNNVPKGYIILSEKTKTGEDGKQETIDIYDEYHPYLFKQHESKKYNEFPKFDAAVDEFYSAIEAQKIELKAMQQEQAALRKLEAVRREQESRVQGLLEQQLTNVRKAELIEENVPIVDAAITIIRNAIASQMDWRDLRELVNQEKSRGNPIAQIIDDLKLETNQITLLLSSTEDESDTSDEEGSEDEGEDEDEDEREEQQRQPQVYKIDVDISATAYANARKYYDQKKSTALKHEKTIAASSKAMKSAERKIKKDLKETRITTSINKIRKPFWFEKFLWFISTEGFLVIAGRDMQQNEMLVKRYLRKDDAYVHADLHGAASVIVKNKPECAGQPIPPSTLFQAGIMSVCQSKAWDAKIVTSAYWVHADQVSKSAPTGEYLTTGSFMIRGKKNYLPPVQLVYGFGYLFKLDESSIGNHVKRSINEDEGSTTGPSADDIESKIDTSTTTPSEVKEAQATPPQPAAEQKEKEKEEEEEESSSSSESEEEFPDTQLAPVQQPKQEPDEAAKEEWKKYELEQHGYDPDADKLPEFAQPGAAADKKSKQAISAKERRQMKKGKKDDQGASQQASQNGKGGKANDKKQQQQQQQQQQKLSRGQRAKAKKIKEKYGEQDEEERRLRMELLGSNKGPQPKGKKAKREAQAKAERLAKEKELAERKAAAAAKEAERKAAEAAAAKQEQDHEQVDEEQHGEEDTEQIRQMLKEENITMLEEDEVANLSVLDSMTPNPLPEDIIHFAIPVCAPYTSLQKYKYKVKLTPGTLKRGKALKQAQSVFLNSSESTAREKELIKSVPDMEAINTMMSKVKVSAPNLEASKRKKGKK